MNENSRCSIPAFAGTCLVPFAGARWQVMHDEVDAQFIGKALEFAFPQPHPRAMAAAAIRSDGQPLGARIANPADIMPPTADCLHRERRGIAAHANTDPAGVACGLVDAIRHGTAEFLDQEVMHLGFALRTPCAAGILEACPRA
jgi:hypothetical protein